jgi:hypothetical protein
LFRLVVLSLLAGTAMLNFSLRPAAQPSVAPTPGPPIVWAPAPIDQSDKSKEELAAVAASHPPQPPSVQDIIQAAFQPLGDSYVDWAEKIAFCESTYDPNAVNSSSGAEGLFQFLPSTWAGTPFASSSPFDPQANAQAAAWLLQTYGPSQWECRA